MRATSLTDVLPAAAASIGVSLEPNIDPLGEFSHAVVLLVDGLGAENLAASATVADQLRGGDTISTVFPSTTPAGLGAFGTGLPPGVHGLIGASFLEPDSGSVVAPLQWRAEPNPIAVQPHSTVFERLERLGVQVHTVAPAAYANSGLTRAVLRGGTYLAADDVQSRLAQVASVTQRPGLTYVYWSELDRTGHVYGVASEEWHDALATANELVSRLRDAMPASAGLIITADHGMVDCRTRVVIDDDATLMAGVQRICGEPRARLIYADATQAAEVVQRWRSRLIDVADVVARDDFARLYGEIDLELIDRFPDLIAVARDDVVLASPSTDDRVSGLIGQHGGITPTETAIPLIVR